METRQGESGTVVLEEVLEVAPPRRHVLDLDDFSRDEIERTLRMTGAMKEVLGRQIKKVPILRGRVVANLFYEPSTRTRVSFEEAGKVLSGEVISVSSGGSSVEKGESLLNTALTLQAMGVDIIVIRHPHSGAPHFVARHAERVRVINAGDGLHAHPTQALLDLYTIQERLDRFRKNVDPERLTPLLTGSASGFIGGTVATALVMHVNGHVPIHPQSALLIIILSAASIALFLLTLIKTQTPNP